MSGLLALLDDVAAIAKLTATSLDDVAGQAAKAGSKAAGAVIDDAAMTPRFVDGIPAARELPMVAKIAGGSIFNKLVILLPVALILSSFAPWAIQPLLTLGGLYLGYEGAEKVMHWIRPGHGEEAAPRARDAAELEERRVSGAIKTDFILSAEIMTIILSALTISEIWMKGAALGLAGVGITLVVYGGVALIVKADDVGLHLARVGRLGITRAAGRALVRGMPGFLTLLATVGTLAMLWVGGSIITHGLHSFGLDQPGQSIEALAETAAHAVPGAVQGAVKWLVTALCDGVFGLAVGFVVLGVVTGVMRLFGKGGH
ncbi:DUF808 domain-containing protein [Acidimangrovimonas sediminis]|uniref:DUF808 domain-containing protein n=1 Tax=Acidimangrovimonas sediminis TaxID=2056283 RepID=UPI000C7F8DB0|nr:DUF808 domain-containing protein [Acidimangrovimonas sediminis]